MLRFALLAGLCCSGLAIAQTNPDEEWGGFPVDPNAPPPAPPPAPLPPADGRVPLAPPPAYPGGPPRSGIAGPAPVPDEPNNTSVYGAPALGQWKRGQTIFLGFPLLGLKLAIGLAPILDFYAGFESFYGVMNEFSTGFKVQILRGSNWSFAASVDGMLALFTQRASKEVRGPRWITAHRNYGVSPGLIVSYQGDKPRSARLFLEARYLLSFDTEPFARDPLNGVPPGLVLGHNAVVHFGAEMPLSARTSFVFLLGLDVHGRSDDSLAMPVASLGLVTGI